MAGEADSNWEFRYRYEILRTILNRNGRALQILSDLEADLNHLNSSDARIRRPVKRIFTEAYLMAQELNLLGNGRYAALFPALDRIRQEVAQELQNIPEIAARPVAVRLDEDDALDSLLVGGKAAGLSSLHRNFPDRVPEGFILTTQAYNLFLGQGDLFDQIRLLLKNLEFTLDKDRFRIQTKAIRDAIVSSKLPDSILEAIHRNVPAGGDGTPNLWAVRSSAVSEDGRFSFAGQFDSLLNVPVSGLTDAYREVVAGKFSERAITYRMHCGFREVDTPMAVLFMPMVDPKAAGVIYTTDPLKSDSDSMVLHCVEGLGECVVKGIGVPDHVEVSRSSRPEIIAIHAPDTPDEDLRYLSEETILDIAATAMKASTGFGYDLDIEWAVDREDRIWLLQGRRLQPSSHEKIKEVKSRHAEPFISKGVSIFPGRAEGPVALRSAQKSDSIPKGAVLALEQPLPELAPLLPNAAAVIASEGSPVGHLATILREFAIPSIFQAGRGVLDIKENTILSVDASRRKIYRGSRWPGIRERVLARLSSTGNRKSAGPLFRLVLSLNLSDPFAPGFKPDACRSVHDVIRFIHEMSVRSMFRFGDKHSRLPGRKTRKLDSDIPLPILVLPLEQSLQSGGKTVQPDRIESVPFQAFWKGFSDPQLAWPDRWAESHYALSKDVQEQVFGGTKGPRRRKDPNYLIYARDYMNLNARFAYHYAMVDALLGKGDRNNYIQLRFHSGGSSDAKRKLRAQFLERVLRECGFGVTLDGDLIVAWYRNYPSADTGDALRVLGRLLVCSRQLDMLMHLDSDVKMFSDHFLAGRFQAFT
ncbi:MAG: PEP/pyruvate-binding domain-containing protein [Acidobacteriota bacterium]